MAFTSSILSKFVWGNRRVRMGNWDSTGVTGGDIATGFKITEICIIGHKGSSTEAASAVINETFPLASGSVTIVATAGDAGYWIAIGR